MLLFWLLTVLILAGCTSPPPLAPSVRSGIYARALTTFDRTVLIKPVETNSPAYRVAPLLVQEVGQTTVPPPEPTEIHVWRTTATLNGELLDRANYVWFHHGEDSCPVDAQGVRITLNREGHPILWEVLRDATGARMLFVTQSLEVDAMKSFPSPLPGRRFWIERSVEEAPDVVVARILDETSTIMGPIVYLQAGTREVSTVICRCMDAQAKELVGQSTYRFVEFGAGKVQALPAFTRRILEPWLPGGEPEELSEILRLPDRSR